MTTDIEPFERECDAGLDFGTGRNADGAGGRGVWVGHIITKSLKVRAHAPNPNHTTPACPQR